MINALLATNLHLQRTPRARSSLEARAAVPLAEPLASWRVFGEGERVCVPAPVCVWRCALCAGPALPCPVPV